MISKSIDINKKLIENLFNESSDLNIYEFQTLSNDNAIIVYFKDMVDKKSINEDLMKPLINDLLSPLDLKSSAYVSNIEIIKSINDMVIPLNKGDIALFIEGLDIAYICNLAQIHRRQVEKPTIEMVIRGPKESFVEDIDVNRTLIRRRIRNNNLLFRDFLIGEQTNTVVSICYINGIVKLDILKNVEEKLNKIKVDKILDGGNIESYLDDNPTKLVSTIAYSEKPDVVASKILEGSVAILTDGSPNVLSVPNLFIENLHSAEDYYIRPQLASFLRIIRLVSLFISIALPGIYISLILFHQEMIPTELLISIAGQREGVPLPSPLEALLMILFFELLKESGIRLPQTMGQTVTLVGGLVIGTAAVDAGLVSAFMVIIVATTGMAELVNPKFREVIPISRLMFLLSGSIAGLYGITLGLIISVTSLTTIKSFGVPYMWPFAPYDKDGIKDTLIKISIKKMNLRPRAIAKRDSFKRNEKIE